MTQLCAGHATENNDAQPITEQPRKTDQKCGEGGHIRRPSDQIEIGDCDGREPNILYMIGEWIIFQKDRGEYSLANRQQATLTLK